MKWLSKEERIQLGEAARKRMARRGHGELSTKARSTSALQLLKRSMRGRVPELIELKYQRMLESPFGYFRGAAPVMAADLAEMPNTGLIAQLCGDAHVRNLGAYAAPDGRLIFDINDFDETIPAPFEWDLKRMSASLILAGADSGHKSGSAQAAVHAFVASYVKLVHSLAELPLIEASRWQVHRIKVVNPAHTALLKAQRSTPQLTLEQLTVAVGTKKNVTRKFRVEKPVLRRVVGKEASSVISSLASYTARLEPQRRHLLSMYKPVDVAFKVVGTGSVGLRDYCVYFEGNGLLDPLFLQVKEEPASCYAPYLKKPRIPKHNGQRVVEGQRAMQVQTDPFLGWTELEGRDYLVRQLNDHKGSIELTDLAGGGLTAYAELCGELLARGHSRSSDAAVLKGYLGEGRGFAEAITAFGVAYAERTEKDWQDLKKARRAK
jgi:uncharacterized protein (DUF2252 family)